MLLRMLKVGNDEAASFAYTNIIFCGRCQQGKQVRGAARDLSSDYGIVCRDCIKEIPDVKIVQ